MWYRWLSDCSQRGCYEYLSVIEIQNVENDGMTDDGEEQDGDDDIIPVHAACKKNFLYAVFFHQLVYIVTWGTYVSSMHLMQMSIFWMVEMYQVSLR